MAQSVFECNLTDNLPLLISSIQESLKKEGIYLGQETVQVKSSQIFEEKAVEAVNDALQQAALLFTGAPDVATAARILEKIQVAAAVAEKAASIVRNSRTRKCSQLAQRIADQSREYFHDLKAGFRVRGRL